MTLSATLNGVKLVVPGTYSSVQVEDNLTNIAPGARNIMIFGEAAKGVPGSQLDLARVFFSDYESLKAYYGSGPLVDAARMIFSNQPSPVFAGAVNRIYTYKTNNSGLASRPIMAGMSLYATISAAEYGEDGNLISSQIQDASTEVKPSFVAHYVMKDQAVSLKFRVSGGAEQTASLAAEATPADLVTAINGLSGISATGGAQLSIIGNAQVGVDTLTVTVDGSLLSRITIACSASFAGADIASVLPGHIVYIPAASAIAGGSQENAGAYAVVSKTANSLLLDKISSSVAGAEVAPVLPINVAATPIAGSQTSPATSELMCFAPISVAVSATTQVGTGASLEMYLASGATNVAQRFFNAATQLAPVSAGVALSASVALSVNAGVGVFSISAGAFQSLPKAGDVLWVSAESVLSGASEQNTGAWIVTASGTTSITATKVVGNGVSISSVALNGQINPFAIQPAIASTSLGAKLHVSSAERQVRLIASRQSDGLSFPAASVGGRIVLELGYVGTSGTVSISKAGKLTTSVVGGSGANLDIQLAKFATMGDLISFINSKTGYKARVSNALYNSLSPKAVLDQVTAAPIATGHSAHAFPARLKADYYDFKKLLDDNFGLVSYVQNTSALTYVGLPDSEALNSFLSGGSVGGTSNASCAAALDAALKVEVTQVLPLFSRDAAKDIEDGLTDSASSYSIDSINELLKAHVATASNVDYRKERFGLASYHGGFEDAIQKAAALSYERIQMFFQMARAVSSDGTSQWFQPWMLACAVAAGRVQAVLGTSMLRKSFAVSDVKHLGDVSVYSDVFVPDFDPDTKDLDRAIEAGLAVLRPVTGFGVRMESPDLSTRSRENDPKGWVYERVSVQFVLDEVLKTSRDTLENYIGSRTSDTSPSVIRKALTDVLSLFVSGGSLRAFSIDSITLDGNTYKVTVSVFPAEAVEFITLSVLARRSVGETA